MREEVPERTENNMLNFGGEALAGDFLIFLD